MANQMTKAQLVTALADATGGWVEARVDHVGTIYDEGNPFGASAWRRESGGLWDVGPHAVALVVPVLGKVTEVSAMVAPRDMTHLLLRHLSGAVSKITLSVDVPPAAAREEAIFAGEAGVWTVPEVTWEPITAYRHALDQLIAAAAGREDEQPSPTNPVGKPGWAPPPPITGTAPEPLPDVTVPVGDADAGASLVQDTPAVHEVTPEPG